MIDEVKAGFVIVGAIATLGWFIAPRPAPDLVVASSLDGVSAVGAKFVTHDGLDCYGDEDAVRRVVHARRTKDDIAANDVRITELARSSGMRLDADQSVTVTLVSGPPATAILHLQIDGGPLSGWKCWSYARDVAAVAR